MTSSSDSGLLVQFDEEQRRHILVEIAEITHGFSDALSTADWGLRRWEVCGLAFEPDTITHWALAHRGRQKISRECRGIGTR